MAIRFVNKGRQGQWAGGMGVPFWLMVIGLVWGVVLAGSWPGAMAQDTDEQPVLQAVDISPLAGNRLQLRFRLSAMPKVAPSSFTINDPARIVLDFLGTTNGLSRRPVERAGGCGSDPGFAESGAVGALQRAGTG